MNTFIRTGISLAVVFILFATSSNIFAQPPGGGGRQGGPQGQQGGPSIPSEKEITEMVGDLAEQISLTSDQETDVLDLYLVHFEEVEDKMKAGRPERSEMEALKSEFEDKVKMLLSDEQIVLFTEFLKEQQQQHQNR